MSLLRRLASRVALKLRYWWRRLASPRVISYGGIHLPVHPTQYSAAVVEELYRERYEEDEAAIVRAMLNPGETVLELGAGIGFVSTVCAKLNANLYCIEANPHLISIAERTFQLNGVRPSLRHAAVGPSKGMIELFVHEEFWRSSTVAGADSPARCVEVPAVRLNDLLKEIRPSFLICDIEGAESQLFDNADLSCIRKVAVEVHPKLVGWDSVRGLVRTLFDSGFILDTAISRNNVLFFRREDSPLLKDRSA
jgi:FkbM family methyltransferase